MNNESLLIKESIYIDLKDHNNVIILIINNVLLNIKIKINIFFIKIIYYIVQKKIIIKILDFTKTITLIMTIINYLF